MDDPQRELKIWLRRELKALGHGSQTAVAKELGVADTAITRMQELDNPNPKARRKIYETEVPIIARFIGKLPPGYLGMTDWLATNDRLGDGEMSADDRIVSEFEKLDPLKQTDVLARAAEIVARRSRADQS